MVYLKCRCGKYPTVTRSRQDGRRVWHVSCAHIDEKSDTFSNFFVIAPTERRACEEWNKFMAVKEVVR